jgi:hypothetical protein
MERHTDRWRGEKGRKKRERKEKKLIKRIKIKLTGHPVKVSHTTVCYTP